MKDKDTGAGIKPETALYIVDDSLRIVSCNNALRRLYPGLEIGKTCYEQLCGERAQCPNCPLNEPEEQNIMFYNQLLNQWIIAHWTNMEWPGPNAPKGRVVMARGLTEGTSSFLSDLAHLYSYDEVFELDIEADSYSTIYRSPSSTSLRAPHGTLSALIGSEAEGIIHPADIPAFRTFWNLGTMQHRLSSSGKALSGFFHEIRSDGSWHLVRRVVSLFRNDEKGTTSAFCFTTLLGSPALPHPSGASNLPEERDQLTGLFRSATFLAHASALVSASEGPWCVVAIDIEHFKLFNKWYGRSTGDQLLRSVADVLIKISTSSSALAGYMGNDKFAVLLRDSDSAVSKLTDLVTETVRSYSDSAGFLPIFGICEVQEGIELIGIYDRAVLALSSIKGQYTVRISRFRSQMLEDMEDEQSLISDVQDALRRHEITFFIQPQCRISTGRIVGGEVLIRWKKNGEHMRPGVFIPILERNGFITNIDRYIWEEACRWLKSLIDRGIRPVPISLNVSRIDIYSLDVAEYFRTLAVKYGLDPSLVKIEITESAYHKAEESDSTSRLAKTTEDLRNAGFSVLMDDFGSGYSSLSMMDRLNIDVLKIDMVFLRIHEKAPRRGSWLINSVIDMANASDLPVIMEGVETREQARLLEDLGCLYAQGYYFYRPMPRSDFENLLQNDLNIDHTGLHAEAAEPLRGNELFNDQALHDKVLNDLMGAVALIEIDEGRAMLQRCNRQWVQLTGVSPEKELQDCLKLMQRIHEEDRPIFLSRVNRCDGSIPEVEDYEVRYFASDEKYHWYQIRAYYLGQRNGHMTYCLSCRNNTAAHAQAKRLQDTSRALVSLLNITGSSSEHYRSPEEKQIGETLLHEISSGGTISVLCNTQLSLYSVSSSFCSMLGYSSSEEFAKATKGCIAGILHPEDRRRVFSKLGPAFPEGYEYFTTGRILRKDGSYLWALNKGRVHITDEGPVIVAAVIDLTDALERQADLTVRSELALNLHDELRFLSSGIPGAYHRTTAKTGFEFLHISDAFLRMTGFSRQEIKSRFDNKLINMVHPTDRDNMLSTLAASDESLPAIEFRLQTASGWIWVMDQFTRMLFEGRTYLQGIAIEISETVHLRNRMDLLMTYSPDRISLMKVFNGEITEEILINGLFRRACTNTRRARCTGPLAESTRLINKKIREAALAGSDVQLTFKALSRPGHPAWISFSATFLSEELGTAWYLVFMRDITTEVLRSQETTSEREKFDATLRLAGISSWDWNIEDRTLTLSYRSGGKGRRMSRTVMGNFPERLLSHDYVPRYFHKTFLSQLNDIRENDGSRPNRFELPLQMPGGRLSWVQIDYETIRNAEGRPIRAIGAYTDITVRKKAEALAQEERSTLELLRSTALYDFKANLALDTIRIDKGREEWAKRTGYACKQFTETMGYISESLVMPEFRDKFFEFSNRDRLMRCFRDNSRMQTMDYACTTDGAPSWRRINIYLSESGEQGDISAYVFVVNIDQQKRHELQLATLAEKDPLTELYNRRSAIIEIEARLGEHLDTPSALIMFDIDDLKQINDSRGHPAGDQAIRNIADRLKASFREGDVLCRLGGDEFLVFCPSIGEADLCRKLQALIDGGNLSGDEGAASLTAGYARYPHDGRIFAELYRKADMALYRAKGFGKKTFFGYDSSMAPEAG